MEENIKIAKFMDLMSDKFQNGFIHYYFPDRAVWVHEEELDFQRSWDLLIPAVQVCFDNAFDESSNLIGDITHALVDLDKEAVYNNILKFIEDYDIRNNKK